MHWERVRVELDAWFADYEVSARAKKAADLRKRFRSRQPRQHFPAWWELYVFRLLRRSFPEAAVVPEIQRPAAVTSPDFPVLGRSLGLPELFVEAVQPATGIRDERRHAAREAEVLDAINEIDERSFWLSITFARVGANSPTKAKLTQPIRTWLRSLDPDLDVHSERSFEEAGWEIRLRAWPRSPHMRTSGLRLIGMGPMSVGYVNDAAAVRSRLEQKAKHYGDLRAPFVIAVMPSSPFDLESALEVFYGSEAVAFSPDNPGSATLIRRGNGFWSPAHGRVSAVLLGPGVLPWTIVQTSPTLWLNPYAEHPFSAESLPVQVAQLDESKAALREITPLVTLAYLFGLPDDWPGPEPAFPCPE